MATSLSNACGETGLISNPTFGVKRKTMAAASNNPWMKTTLKNVSGFYPAYVVYSKCRRFLEHWRYHRLVKRNGLPIYDETPMQKLSKEVAYIDILSQLKRSNPWLSSPIYPVGGAASHGLIYILMRSLLEHSFENVLELGVGQTTRILSAYSKFNGTQITSLEENSSWANQLGLQCAGVSHRVYHAPLVKSIYKTFWYDLQSFRSELPSTGFDLFLIDGPIGSRRFSRVGIVEYFFSLCADQWLVIWDDLHRVGDLESFVVFINAARERKLDFNIAFSTATKTVGVAYTPKYSKVRHYF